MKVRNRVRIIFLTIFSTVMTSIFLPAVLLPSSFSDKVISSQEEVEFPQSRWCQKAREFWTFFLQKDRSGLERFFAECLPPERLKELSASERARRLIELKEKLGEVALRKVNVPRPQEITMVLSSSGGTFWQLGLRFEQEGEKLLLQGIFLEEAGPDALLPPLPAMNLDQALRQLDQEISLAAAEDRFSGVVLVAKDFKPVYFKPYGLASREFGVPNRLDTKFNLGSINKIFTKIAVAQLAEKGSLSLEAKLGSFLPDYPNPEAREKVSVKHLVEMTSGIGDFFGPDFQKMPKEVLRHNGDYLALFASKPLAFEPGTKQLYSNGSYIVLGEIIARVSGMDYYDYIQKNIFGVAGMKDSAWYEADEPIPNLAEGYTRERAGMNTDLSPATEESKRKRLQLSSNEVGRADQLEPGQKKVTQRQPGQAKAETEKIFWRRNIYTRPARGSAAGGGYATAEDLLRFIQMLYEGKLVSLAFTDWVFGAPEPRPGQVRNQQDVNRENWNIGLAGGAPGINASLEFEARSGWTVIVLANVDPPAAANTARLVKRYLRAVTN